MRDFSYDIALSYAGEDEAIVSSVYRYLRGSGASVFFAPECQAELVGEHQEEIFYQIFSQGARYAVLFVSRHYVAKPTPMKEAKICMANRQGSHLIPVYVDGTVLPGLNASINYFRSDEPEKIAAMIIEKAAKGDGVKGGAAGETLRQSEWSQVKEQKAYNTTISNVQGNGNVIIQGDGNKVGM